jgi:hypothetical protein
MARRLDGTSRVPWELNLACIGGGPLDEDPANNSEILRGECRRLGLERLGGDGVGEEGDGGAGFL